MNVPPQRAGDYILKWAEELNLQASKTFGGTTATTSTLVKRGVKTESADDHPSKRVKVEDSTSGVEDEVKRCYQKGTVSKVSIKIMSRGKLLN